MENKVSIKNYLIKLLSLSETILNSSVIELYSIETGCNLIFSKNFKDLDNGIITMVKMEPDGNIINYHYNEYGYKDGGSECLLFLNKSCMNWSQAMEESLRKYIKDGDFLQLGDTVFVYNESIKCNNSLGAYMAFPALNANCYDIIPYTAYNVVIPIEQCAYSTDNRDKVSKIFVVPYAGMVKEWGYEYDNDIKKFVCNFKKGDVVKDESDVEYMLAEDITDISMLCDNVLVYNDDYSNNSSKVVGDDIYFNGDTHYYKFNGLVKYGNKENYLKMLYSLGYKFDEETKTFEMMTITQDEYDQIYNTEKAYVDKVWNAYEKDLEESNKRRKEINEKFNKHMKEEAIRLKDEKSDSPIKEAIHCPHINDNEDEYENVDEMIRDGYVKNDDKTEELEETTEMSPEVISMIYSGRIIKDLKEHKFTEDDMCLIFKQLMKTEIVRNDE